MFETEEFDLYRENIKSQYKEELGNAKPELVEDIIKIKFFLTNQIAILAGLAKLEEELSSTAAALGIEKEAFINSSETKTYKILSKTLGNFLSTTVLEHQVKRIETVLKPYDFLYIFRKGYMFKDTGVLPTHGEWTHFIQWYLIFNNEELKAALSRSFEEIYMDIGSCWLSKVMNNNLWDITVDSLSSKIKTAFDFSSPEKVMHYLLKENTSFQLLTACLSKRREKRTPKATPKEHFAFYVYHQSQMAEITPVQEDIQEEKIEEILEVPITKEISTYFFYRPEPKKRETCSFKSMCSIS